MEKKELYGKPQDGADTLLHELLSFKEEPARSIACHDPHYAAMLAIEAAKRVDAAIARLNNLLSRINQGSGSGSGEGSGSGSGEGSGNVIINNSSVKSAFKMIYKQSIVKPDRPYGGSYNFDTDVLTPPSGWKNVNDFTGDSNIYYSYNTFYNDGTNAGWSDPVLFVDYDKLFDRIHDQIDALYNNMLEDADLQFKELLEDAAAQIADAKAQIDNAKAMIDDAKEKLDALEESTGEQGITEAIAKIQAFAKWYDKESGNIFDMNFNIDGINGKITQMGTRIDTLNGRVNTVRTDVDAQNAKIESFGRVVDTVNDTVTTVSHTLDAQQATIESMATQVDVNKDDVNTVKTTLSAQDARITSIASTVNTASANATYAKQEIDGIKGSITLTVATELQSQLGDSVSEAVDTAISTGRFEITPTQIVSAITNSEGVGTAIIQQINNNTSETIISADQIALDGDTIATMLHSKKLDINNGASVFEPDGSGHVATGNISWDKYGNLNIAGGFIEVSPTGEIVSTKVSDFPLGTILATTNGENPFGTNWTLLGFEDAFNTTIYYFEKTIGGNDTWLTDPYKPDYTYLDNHHAAVMDIYGNMYGARSEWVAAGSKQIAGIALSNGSNIRFCLDTRSFYVSCVYGIGFQIYSPNSEGEASYTSVEWQTVLNLCPLEVYGDSGLSDTRKLEKALAYYNTIDQSVKQYTSQSTGIVAMIEQIMSLNSPTGKRCYIPTKREAEIIQDYKTNIEALITSFNMTSLNDHFACLPMHRSGSSTKIGSYSLGVNGAFGHTSGEHGSPVQPIFQI